MIKLRFEFVTFFSARPSLLQCTEGTEISDQVKLCELDIWTSLHRLSSFRCPKAFSLSREIRLKTANVAQENTLVTLPVRKSVPANLTWRNYGQDVGLSLSNFFDFRFFEVFISIFGNTVSRVFRALYELNRTAHRAVTSQGRIALCSQHSVKFSGQ